MVIDRRILSATIALLMGTSIWVIYRWAFDYLPVVTVVVTTAGTLGLMLTLGRVRGSVVALLVTAALNRYVAEFSGVSIRPEHLAVIIVAIALLPDLPRLIRRIDLVSALFLGWLGWMVIGGLVNAPDPANSTKLWVMLLLAAFPYFVITSTSQTAGRLHLIVNAWLAIATIVGLFGLITHFLFAAQNIDLGIQINPVTLDPTVAATFREANLFGSGMLLLALSATGLLIFLPKPSPGIYIAALTGLVAIQVSFTRTAWVALFAGFLLLATLKIIMVIRFRDAGQDISRSVKRLGVLFGVGAIATALVWVPVSSDKGAIQRNAIATSESETATMRASTPGNDTANATLPHLQLGTPTVTVVVPTHEAHEPDIGGRLSSISDTSDSSISVRIEFARQALRDWKDHPIIGQGIGSFGQKYISTSFDRAWLSNVFVRILHDGGLIGLILFLLPLGLLAWQTLQVYWHGLETRAQATAVAMGVAITGMFIAFQATEGIQLGWYWCSLGILAAATVLSREQTRRSTHE